MASIFISYRRADTAPWAGRIYERLARDLKADNIFMDVDAINPGLDFVKEVEHQVDSCDVFIAVIGREWTSARNADGSRRLDDPNDLVRVELATALDRDILVIPVLVDGASMPKVEELPDVLKAVSRRNAVELTHVRFGTDVQRLVSTVGQLVDETQRSRKRPIGDKSKRLDRYPYFSAFFISMALLMSGSIHVLLIGSYALLLISGMLAVSTVLLILKERIAKPIGVAATCAGIACFIYVYVSWMELVRVGALSTFASLFPLFGAALLALGLGFLLRWRSDTNR